MNSPTLNVLWDNMYVSISASKPAFAALLGNPDSDTNPQNRQKFLRLLKPLGWFRLRMPSIIKKLPPISFLKKMRDGWNIA